MATAVINPNKYASEFPLPGGVEQYFDTLVALLRYVRDNNISPDDLTKWMFATFPNASGPIAVNGYISVLSRLGLKSDLIGALAETERGSLYTRVSPMILTNKLSQLTRTMDLTAPPKS